MSAVSEEALLKRTTTEWLGKCGNNFDGKSSAI